MINNTWTNSVKIALVTVILTVGEHSASLLPNGNYSVLQPISEYGFGFCPMNMTNMHDTVIPPTRGQYMLHSPDYLIDWSHKYSPDEIQHLIKTKNYYPASEYNKGFGKYTLQEIGNGNRRFTAIDGEVSECLPDNPKDAFKEYGDEIYKYDPTLGDDIDSYELRRGSKLTDGFRSDLEALRSPLTKKRVYIPAEACNRNIHTLRNYASDMREKGRMLEKKGLHTPSFKGVHEGQYMQDFFQHADNQLSATPAQSSNQYIQKNIDNIFPTTARISEATADELSKGECVEGAFRQYIAKDGTMPALCVGNDVDGDYVVDYLVEHPEITDWASRTFMEAIKFGLRHLKDGASTRLRKTRESLSKVGGFFRYPGQNTDPEEEEPMS